GRQWLGRPGVATRATWSDNPDDDESAESDDPGKHSNPHVGRLGACLLPQVSEQAPGVCRGVLERNQLEGLRSPLLEGLEDDHLTSASIQVVQKAGRLDRPFFVPEDIDDSMFGLNTNHRRVW